ncbi:MAG: sulfite exporter TauE/SafE family protein [Gammaproteobacteria bacterium]|nr:sulfite exporter TauE/SafE family protein [Gammaproteobacteria bacterium]
MDFTLYWFMFPVSIGVATCAMLSGIGGAALFTPIFVLIFPLLGPEYALQTTVAAIGTALLTQTFGFMSGFVGYYRKGTIDFALAYRFLRVAMPVAIAGALASHWLHDGVLIAAYAVLVFSLAIGLIFFRRRSHPDKKGGISGVIITAVGAFLTGLVSVGIGEVIISQLTRRGIPVATAAATSVAVVIVTVACASITQIVQLIRDGGLAAVPWHLVSYTIPGVIIGGQIGPRLQGRVAQRTMERAIGVLFIVLAIAMLFVALGKFG